MLYDASGFRIDFPVKYIIDSLKRRSSSLHSSLTTEHAATLFYQWWDRTSMYDKHCLANEMVLGFSKRSKLVKNHVTFQKLAEWVRSANLTRGIAPTRADIMFQYAVVRNLDVNNADILNTTGRANMKLEKNLSFFKRFVRKWHLKRSSIRARLMLTEEEIRTAASPLLF